MDCRSELSGFSKEYARGLYRISARNNWSSIARERYRDHRRGHCGTYVRATPVAARISGDTVRERQDAGGQPLLCPSRSCITTTSIRLFCDWYVNFWNIVENDLKITRDKAFEARLSVKLVDPINSGRQPTTTLQDISSSRTRAHCRTFWTISKSGTLPRPTCSSSGSLCWISHPSRFASRSRLNSRR